MGYCEQGGGQCKYKFRRESPPNLVNFLCTLPVQSMIDFRASIVL